MAGVKGRSGRKRKIKNIQKYFNDQIDLNSPRLIDITIQKALEGDREMIIYCWDRRLGRPKQSSTVELEGGEKLSSVLVQSLFAAIDQRRLEQAQVIQIEQVDKESE